MTRRTHWSLRTRLIIAFLAVAIVAAESGNIYTSLHLQAHVTAAARQRLQHAAKRLGSVAGSVYAAHGGWTGAALTTLRGVAAAEDLNVHIEAPAGSAFSLPADDAPQAGAVATAPVMAGGARIGTVVVSRIAGSLLTQQDTQLRRDLMRTSIIAGAIAAVVALGIAIYLAQSLSQPLRRIRAGAEAMRPGNLGTRVPETGGEEIRSISRALNRLASTLEREEELRQENVEILAHELRTPVMGLLMRVEATQDGLVDDEKANVDAMHDEVVRLTRLLDDLSALADAERPGQALFFEDVDLGGVAAIQVGVFSTRFAAKRVSAREELDHVLVSGDPQRLQQILANLLSNALEYTEAGGSVTVSVQREGDAAVLEVADDGVGIAKEDLPHVFSRFWRSERSIARDADGSGLGLAIVRELTLAHGGTVGVDSEIGRGTRFRITLPALPVTAPSR